MRQCNQIEKGGDEAMNCKVKKGLVGGCKWRYEKGESYLDYHTQ